MRWWAGAIDSWLVYKLTGQFKTDYSNASRTQLFNINTLAWDKELCALFGVDPDMLPEVCMSDSDFDETVAVPDVAAGMMGGAAYEIHYYGFGRPSFRDFVKTEGRWKAEVIDTWEMTITDAGVHEGKFRVKLPGKEYMAIRLTRVD